MPRYQVSVYRTIGPLVVFSFAQIIYMYCENHPIQTESCAWSIFSKLARLIIFDEDNCDVEGSSSYRRKLTVCTGLYIVKKRIL